MGKKKENKPRSILHTAMTSFRFIQFTSFLFTQVSALSNRYVPLATSSPEQALFGGYSNGESCLLGGGSNTFGTGQIWMGKPDNQVHPKEDNNMTKPPSTFVPPSHRGS